MPLFRTPLRFSLRTLFVLVTVLCVWFGYHVRWMNQRNEFVLNRAIVPAKPPPVSAPFGLRLLGVNGLSWLGTSESDAAEAKVLFPEAEIEVYRAITSAPGP